MTDVDLEYGRLLKWLQAQDFRVVILEGARGVGKTTLCDRLLKNTDLAFYKTWGRDQRTERTRLQSLGLDLTQGAFFALDVFRQVETKHPVLVDRCILSSIRYQADFWEERVAAHDYYISLMRETRAVLLYLECYYVEVARRRIARGEGDEQRLDLLDPREARRIVNEDLSRYDTAIEILKKAGLQEQQTFDLGGGTTCYAYTPI